MAIYWFTGTSASSAWLYHENAHMNPPTEPATEPVTEPAMALVGLAFFVGGFKAIRRFVDRDHQHVVSWR